MRIVLSSFGTLGDIHPLIALALELQRGATRRCWRFPKSSVPRSFRWGWNLPRRPYPRSGRQSARSHVDGHSQGNGRTLREILFPAIRQSYRELLAVVEAKGGADLLLAGELVYQAPIVAEVTGIPWASHVLAPLSFFPATMRPCCRLTQCWPVCSLPCPGWAG